MTSIHVPIPDLDINQDGRVSLDEMIRGAMWIMRWAVISIMAAWFAVVGIAYVIHPWDEWMWAARVSIIVLFLSIAIGIGAAAVIGIKRSLLPEWQKKYADKDMELEHLRKKFEYDVLRGVNKQVDETNGDASTQDHYARLFLNLSYERNKFITRADWTAQGLPEDWWNRINQLMQKYRIREGKSSELRYDTLSEAWGVWCDAIIKTRSWVRSGDDFIPN